MGAVSSTAATSTAATSTAATSTVVSSTVEADRAAVERIRAARVTAATGPRGVASFRWGDFVRAPDTVVPGAPGRWSPLPEGRAGLRVDAVAAEGVRLDGELVDGSGELFADAADGPAVAVFPDGAEGVLFTYDHRSFALQVWDPAAAAERGFAGIAAFPYDPAWRVDARVSPLRDGRTVAVTHHRDPRPVDVPVVAEVVFQVDGARHRLLATAGPAAGLMLHFTDATSGTESYGAGRLLRVPSPAEGVVTLDFNRTGLLPCSFSPAWNCPIPPRENRLPIPVRAGERDAVDAEGNPLS